MSINSDDPVKAKRMKIRFVFEFLFSLAFAGVFFVFGNTSMMVLGLFFGFWGYTCESFGNAKKALPYVNCKIYE